MEAIYAAGVSNLALIAQIFVGHKMLLVVHYVFSVRYRRLVSSKVMIDRLAAHLFPLNFNPCTISLKFSAKNNYNTAQVQFQVIGMY